MADNKSNKNTLSDADVEHVAKLAHLTLTDDEKALYKKQLSEVIDFFEELSEVDTKDVEPTSQTTGLLNRKRKDKVNANRYIPQETAISQAKEKLNGYVSVPLTLKERSVGDE